MNLDSKIAEFVLTAFADAGKPCLGVHDSFIVKVADEALLRDTMIEAYRQYGVTGVTPPISRRSNFDADLELADGFSAHVESELQLQA